MSSPNVTMPRWPAYLMGAFAVACAYPAVTMPPPGLESYNALADAAASAAPTGRSSPTQQVPTGGGIAISLKPAD
jgi:hypothetical protein